MEQKLALHIQELNSVLAENGYDGYFLCNGHSGKIPECLANRMAELSLTGRSLQDSEVRLLTYTEWQPDEPPRESDTASVQCLFKVQYDIDKGFLISEMEFEKKFGARTVNHFIKEIRNDKKEIVSLKEVNKVANDLKFLREYSREMRPKILKQKKRNKNNF